MKKTLIIGLALAFGLNACSPMMHLGDLAYIRVQTEDGKILGETAWGDEDWVDYDGFITLNAENEKIALNVSTTMVFWNFGHVSPPLAPVALKHKYTADKLTDAVPPTWTNHDDVVPSPENFYAIPDGVSDDGIGDMWIENDYMRLTYRCPITVWGYVKDNKLVLWEDGPRELPILKYQMFSGPVTVTRKVGTTEIAIPLPPATVDTDLLTFLMDTYPAYVTDAATAVACMEADFVNNEMLSNVERVVEIKYTDYAFEMHVEGTGAAVPGNSPKYSGFHVVLPKLFQETTAITYKLK